eukprot:c19074_g2_i1 orf=415-1806(-)
MFSPAEEKLIIRLHSVLGNRWSQIASHVTGRTDNEIKNYWNTCIKKKLRQAGIDPVLQKLIGESFGGARERDSLSSTNSNPQSQLNLSFKQLHAGANDTSDDLKLTSKSLGSSEDAISHAKGKQFFHGLGNCNIAEEYNWGSGIQLHNFLSEESNVASKNASENECQKDPSPINAAKVYGRLETFPQRTISDIKTIDDAQAALSSPYWCFLYENRFPQYSFCDEPLESHKLHPLLTVDCIASEQWSAPNVNSLNWEEAIIEGMGVDFYRNPNAGWAPFVKPSPIYERPSISNGTSSDQDLSFGENVAFLSSTDTRSGSSSKLFDCGNLTSCNANSPTSVRAENLIPNPSEANYIDLYTASLVWAAGTQRTESPECSIKFRQQIRSFGTELSHMVHAPTDSLPSVCAGEQEFHSTFQDVDVPIRVELPETIWHPENGSDLYEKCKSGERVSAELHCIAAMLGQM